MRPILLLALLVAPLVAGPHRFSSGEGRTHLIELFSSEGCSSCPPAEKWLGALRDAPGLWRDFVPVAFHVNYWDRLGWPDRFASKEYTARQYAYADVWRAGTVYTPGFVLDGRDWREGVGRTLPQAGNKAGILAVEIREARCAVVFQPASGADQAYEVHIALLGGGIQSKVRAGENRGETLQHEFVALALVTHRLENGQGEFALPASTLSGATRRSLAVWVTRAGSSEPLQATGGWLE